MPTPKQRLDATEAVQRLSSLAGDQRLDLTDDERTTLRDSLDICQAIRRGERG